jgi:hypothetical protein
MDEIKKLGKFFEKIVEDIKKVLPMIMNILTFFTITIPKFIFGVTKGVGLFVKKAAPISLAVIISFFALFFGIQYIMKKITGLPSMIPHYPLAIFCMFLLYSLVMKESKELKMMQSGILKGFVLLFNNSLLKDLIGFNVKIDSKNPEKSSQLVLAWIFKNIIKVIFVLLLLIITIQIGMRKIWKYITFYSKNN